MSEHLRAAIAALDAAEAAYLDEQSTIRVPSASLIASRQEAEELAAAVLENHVLANCYRSGLPIAAVGDCVRTGVVPPAAAVLDPDRSRVVGELATLIGRQNIALSQAQARTVRLEDEELLQPLRAARQRYLSAVAALETAIGAELASQPITVSSITLHGAVSFGGAWQWEGGPAADAALIATIEQTLADVRATMARQRQRLAELEEQADWSYWAWHRVRERLIERAEFDAKVDAVVQFVTDVIEVAVAVGTVGTWTFVKAGFLVGDTALRLYGYSTLDDSLAARIAAIGRSQLSDAFKATIVARIRAGLSPDAIVDFGGARPIVAEALGAASVPLGGISREAAKSAVAAWLDWIENGGTQPAASRAYAWLSAATPDPPATARSLHAVEAAVSRLPGFGLSAGLAAASSGLVPFLREIAYGAFGADPATTEALMQRLAIAELQLFVLNEQVATLRGLLALLEQGEPAILEALGEARIRLAADGARRFVDPAGIAIDRTGAVPLPTADSAVTVTVRVENARLRWRLDVVDVLGGRETRLGTVTVDGDTASLSFVPPATDGGPAGVIEVRISGAERQPLDADPATMPAINIAEARWTGIEPGPDIYRFAFVVAPAPPICPAEQPPGYVPGAVVSTFTAGTEGWTVVGDAGPEPDYRDGLLTATDYEGGDTWYWEAPPRFLGDRQSLFGTGLVYGLWTDGTGAPFEAPDVILEGGGLTLVLYTEMPTEPRSFTHRLDSSSPWISWTPSGPRRTPTSGASSPASRRCAFAASSPADRTGGGLAA